MGTPESRTLIQIRAEYYKWRSTIPWSDAEILKTLSDQLACVDPEKCRDRYDHLVSLMATTRNRQLTDEVVRAVLPDLVKICSICGRKARHYIDLVGRCHYCRDIPVPGQDDRNRQYREKSANISQEKRLKIGITVRRAMRRSISLRSLGI